jgi:citrate lyase subunit beta/citryl-CoA lyase
MYSPGNAALRIRVASSVGVLFGRAIESAARAAAGECGVSTGELAIEDDGALDYVIAARVEDALRRAGFHRATAQGSQGRVSIDTGAIGSGSILDGKARRRRSRLYIPGNQPDLMPNAGLFGSDSLVLDLEDSVAPSSKAEALILLRRALESHRSFFQSAEIIVRINPLSGSQGRNDLDELAACLPDAILLPKCEDSGSVAELSVLLDGFEAASGMRPGNTLILPLVETARGVLASASIAAASSRVTALCFGAEDFTRDIGARRTAAGSETAYARAAIVVAARAAGVQALDSVYSDTEDDTGFAAYCAASRAMGFDGVGLVHPRQVAAAHAAFTPDLSEVAEARRVVAALKEAKAHGLGVASLDGRMVDAPVAERARRIVALAELDSGGNSVDAGEGS